MKPGFIVCRQHTSMGCVVTLAKHVDGIYEPVASFADDTIARRCSELLERHGLIDTALIDTGGQVA